VALEKIVFPKVYQEVLMKRFSLLYFIVIIVLGSCSKSPSKLLDNNNAHQIILLEETNSVGSTSNKKRHSFSPQGNDLNNIGKSILRLPAIQNNKEFLKQNYGQLRWNFAHIDIVANDKYIFSVPLAKHDFVTGIILAIGDTDHLDYIFMDRMDASHALLSNDNIDKSSKALIKLALTKINSSEVSRYNKLYRDINDIVVSNALSKDQEFNTTALTYFYKYLDISQDEFEVKTGSYKIDFHCKMKHFDLHNLYHKSIIDIKNDTRINPFLSGGITKIKIEEEKQISIQLEDPLEFLYIDK